MSELTKAVKQTLWFIRRSWSYLGCDEGTGRWDARRRYFRNIVPKAVWFYRVTRLDNGSPSRGDAAKKMLEAHLTAVQGRWRTLMAHPDRPNPDDAVALIVEMASFFSVAWLLDALMNLDPAEADRQAVRLQAALDAGDEIGEWTWQMLSDLGIDPDSIGAVTS